MTSTVAGILRCGGEKGLEIYLSIYLFVYFRSEVVLSKVRWIYLRRTETLKRNA